MALPYRSEPVLTTPPHLAIEILSAKDEKADILAKVAYFLRFGIPHTSGSQTGQAHFVGRSRRHPLSRRPCSRDRVGRARRPQGAVFATRRANRVMRRESLGIAPGCSIVALPRDLFSKSTVRTLLPHRFVQQAVAPFHDVDAIASRNRAAACCTIASPGRSQQKHPDVLDDPGQEP